MFELAHGRRLAWDEYGDPDGAPVLYFHGVPSTALDIGMFDGPRLAAELGIRLLSVDRPGCGRSDRLPGRRLVDWPGDVRALADGLGLGRFAVLGWSGGAPYALACADRLGDRVTSVALVSGVVPFGTPGVAAATHPTPRRFFRLCLTSPPLGRTMLRLMRLGVERDPAAFLRQTAEALPQVDREILAQPAVADAYRGALSACLRPGPVGAQADTALAVGRWEMSLSTLAPPVTLWHGGQDGEAPLIGARWLADQVPGSRLNVLPDEGHLSLVAHHGGQILKELASV
jgi:pimeloyl-ACP methyl ester carboxylesterase